MVTDMNKLHPEPLRTHQTGRPDASLGTHDQAGKPDVPGGRRRGRQPACDDDLSRTFNAGVCQERQGWITLEAAAVGVAVHEALAVHADWLGPVKLLHGPDGVRQRVEFSLPPHDSRVAESFLDESELQPQKVLRRELLGVASEILAHPSDAKVQNRIAASVIRGWLQADGHVVADDEQGHLRLGIPSAGFDGQVCIEASEQRLRLRMALGDWFELPAAVESAMIQLAAEANARTRLLRVVWRKEGPRRRCESQVDLSGLPRDAADPGFERLAQHMVRLSTAALALAARRLGRELAVLAANRELAEVVNEHTAACPWTENLSDNRIGPGTLQGHRRVLG